MKSKITKVIVLALALLTVFGTVQAFAYEAYDTYTYSIDGDPLMSPTAYSANMAVTSYDMGLVTPEFGNKALGECTDLVTDHEGNVYIADKGNNRIVVLNKYYSTIAIIDEYIDEYGRPQKLNAPQGVFVTDPTKTADKSSYIYVCDSGNAQLVVFKRDFGYERTIPCPESPLITKTDFYPIAMAVDIYGRIFVVSQTANEGVIVLSSQGDFTGFIGAQKVSYSLLQIIWRRFQTEEQRAASDQNVSVAYNNITVDDEGFVYVTTDKIDKQKQFAALKSKSADYSPVKKLNSTGVEIMRRNGFFDPSGEVVSSFAVNKVSTIVDIALGEEGSWTILDNSRSRMFTYDQDGNLLFAFGDKGQQLGNGEAFVAVTYQKVDGVNYMLALDRTASGYKIAVYSPTEYCDTIMSALRNQNLHNYSASIDYWQEVLTRNNNFDLAYIGIGKALYNQGHYDEAREYLERSYETDYASLAFAESRKDVIGKSVIWIVLGAAVVLFGLTKFLGYAKKKNKVTTLKVGRKTYWEELIYVFHLVFHPFDGFWDLKHEKRGSVRAGTTILAITVIAFFYNSIGKGYLFNPKNTYSTIISSLISIVVPVMLWAISNWCLTTLFDGEGSFKDIYVATCYALAPLPLFVVISTLLTNVLDVTGASMVNLIMAFGFIWAIVLLFFGTLVTHDYSLGKNLITIIGTILAMAIIMFVIILFSSLVIKMVTFVIAIFKEVGNRI